MKLVLLPGMDGTGRLFEPFLRCLGAGESQIIPLPDSGPQDYESLAKTIYLQLPKEPFTLLAESFSGAIAIRLIAMGHEYLKKVVFASSFLSSPGKLRTRFMSQFSLDKFVGLPFASAGIKLFCLGRTASKANIAELLSVVEEVPSDILKFRLREMSNLSNVSANFEIPALCLIATKDRLIQGSRYEFEQTFENIVVQEIDGPHFLLQACPEECASEVRAFMAL